MNRRSTSRCTDGFGPGSNVRNHFAIVALALCLTAPNVAPAQSPNFQWAARAGTANADSGSDVAVSGTGTSYATGFFQSANADFAGVTLTNQGVSDIFIAKYDSAGNVLWARSAGGNGNDAGYGVAIDAIGVDANTNCYVTGFFGSANADFGAFVLSTFGSSDIFVTKYDPAGAVAWVRQAGGTASDSGRGIAVDWQLEGATNLPAASWASVTNVPGTVGGESVVTNSATGLSRFFRLRKL